MAPVIINKPIVASFFLPDEALSLTRITAQGGKITKQGRSEPHLNGAMQLHFSRYSLTPTDPSGMTITYSVNVGSRVVSSHVTSGPPTYGYMDQNTIATSLDYILPQINQKIIYDLKFSSDHYQLVNLTGLSGTTTSAGIYNHALLAGNSTVVPSNGPFRILSMGTASPSREDSKKLQSTLEALTSIGYASTGKDLVSPLILAIKPSAPHTAIELHDVSDSVILDTFPLTPERGMRLVELIMRRRFDENVLVRPDERWFTASLPKYFALLVASKMSWVDKTVELNRIRTAIVRKAAIPGTLASITNQTPLYRQYLSEERGLLAIAELDKALLNAGYSIKDLTYLYVTRSQSSIKDHLVQLLGTVGRDLWKQLVTTEFMPKEPEAIALRDHPIQNDTKVSPNSNKLITFRLTGSFEGFIENCGCKANQTGGASRRSWLLKHSKPSNVATFNLGNLFTLQKSDHPDPISSLEALLQLDLVRQSRYDAVALGYGDFEYLKNRQRLLQVPVLTSANLKTTVARREIRLGNRRFDVIGWTDPPRVVKFQNVNYLASEDAGVTFSTDHLLKRVKESLATTDGVIVIGQIEPSTVTKLAGIPGVIAIFSGLPLFSGTLEGYLGNSFVSFYSANRYNVTELNGHIDNKIFVKRSRRTIRLNDSVSQDPEVIRAVDDFYNSSQFRDAVKSTSPDMQPRRIVGIETQATQRFVGSRACISCHVSEYVHWKGTAHAGAMTTLVTKRRDKNPDCVSCHVVGMNQPSGFSIEKFRPDLQHVGCEACHGAGSTHLSNPKTTNIVGRVSLTVCFSCHTSDHSSMNTDPDKYWKLAQHGVRSGR